MREEKKRARCHHPRSCDDNDGWGNPGSSQLSRLCPQLHLWRTHGACSRKFVIFCAVAMGWVGCLRSS